MTLTASEEEIVRRTHPDVRQWLDDDARASCMSAAKTTGPDPRVGSIAARLKPLDESRPLGWIETVRRDPQRWFQRFGAVGLLATAEDTRDRMRLLQALGPDQLGPEDLELLSSCGPHARAAMRDAAAVLNRTFTQVPVLIAHLGMYLTAMAIGRRHAAELAVLASESTTQPFGLYVERALTTSRLSACRELRNITEAMT